MALSRDQLLKRIEASCKAVELHIPEWDATVRVRELTARERSDLVNQIGRNGKPSPLDLQAKVVSWCVIDDAGARLFNDGKDVVAIAGGSSRAVERIYDAVSALSFLGAEGLEAAKKNSETTLSEG